MKNSTLILLIAALLLVVATSYGEDYYVYPETPMDPETTISDPPPAEPVVIPYAMPESPHTVAISSAAATLMSDIVDSTDPTLCVVSADDNFYLNGTLATPSLGIFLAKDTPHLIPNGVGVTFGTTSDTVNLKILPVK